MYNLFHHSPWPYLFRSQPIFFHQAKTLQSRTTKTTSDYEKSEVKKFVIKNIEKMLTTKQNKSAKVLICGMKNVGKTSLVEQLIYGNVTLESVSKETLLQMKDLTFFVEIQSNH